VKEKHAGYSGGQAKPWNAPKSAPSADAMPVETQSGGFTISTDYYPPSDSLRQTELLSEILAELRAIRALMKAHSAI
jgi:hypothetical protein